MRAGVSEPLSAEEVLTLSQWDEMHILLRIGHQFGIGEDIVPLLLHCH